VIRALILFSAACFRLVGSGLPSRGIT